MTLLLSLFYTFFKIGTCMFGGGYAMLPLIEREVINNKKWITSEELLEITSIAQMTPGPIATNTATYIGTKLAGSIGALFATLGVIAPSYIIISLIFYFLSDKFELPAVVAAFTAIKACILGLILSSVKKLYKAGIKDNIGLFIFSFAFILLLFFGIHPIILILIVGIGALTSALIIPDFLKERLGEINK